MRYENILSKIHLHKIFYTTPKVNPVTLTLIICGEAATTPL